MRTLIVTAANEAFAPLLKGLVLSIRQWPLAPGVGLACLDVGLEAPTVAWLARHGVQVQACGWDLPVAPSLREEKPWLRANIARYFLPEHFPGHDVYMWMDADTWVQRRFGLEWFLKAAVDGSIAVVPHADVSYRAEPGTIHWRGAGLRAYYGEASARRVLWDRYMNAGVFALRAGAVHWKAIRHRFVQGLKNCAGKRVEDQAALNQALWVDDLPVRVLPALCNWQCHLALPHWDAQRAALCEPAMPQRPIGIVHLTAATKHATLADGRSLRFPATH